MLTPEASPEPVSKNTLLESSRDPHRPQQQSSRLNLKITVPSTLLPHFASKKTRQLYESIPAELKARLAVIHAFGHSPTRFLREFKVLKVVGFGANGVVLGAKHVSTGRPVAIKIIYKARISHADDPFPSEVFTLKELGPLGPTCSRHALEYITSWQDSHHFYLVTNLFGTAWLSSIPESNLPPLTFDTKVADALRVTHTFPFSTGSCDLWAWQSCMRMRQYHLSGGSLYVPLRPIQHLFRETVTAVHSLHMSGYYHGDIKLENILAESASQCPNGIEHPRLMLSDFGNSRRVECGIKRYATQEVSPPEFLRDSPFVASNRWIDGRKADVFALGIVLFMLMSETGCVPAVSAAIQRGGVGYQQLLEFDEGRYMFSDVEVMPWLGEEGGAWELLNGMCFVDPDRRMGLEQVLMHPWLH
ncbi:hypothetical protein HDU98_011639 [Podochytrium sp. JEL0797]|nr:hypothetical protein HDU98_011639 [Podochytrium sp. JEL0797]